MKTEIEPISPVVPESQPAPVTGVVNDIKEYVSFVKQQASLRMLCASFIEMNIQKFIEVGAIPSGYEHWIDLDNLTREQVVKALKLFPGKYQKEVNNSAMHYTHDLGNGLFLRFYNAALPPGCKLVEKTVDVPAQPATTRKVFEIQCGGGDES